MRLTVAMTSREPRRNEQGPNILSQLVDLEGRRGSGPFPSSDGMKTEKEKGRHEAEACSMAMCTSFGTSAVDGVDYEDKKREHSSPWTLRTFSKEAKRKSRSVSLAPFYSSVLS